MSSSFWHYPRTPLPSANICQCRKGIPHARANGINIRTTITGQAHQLPAIDAEISRAKEADLMRYIDLRKAFILVGTIALGCAGATVDASARGGAAGGGGGHAGHAAIGGGFSSGHAGLASSHAASPSHGATVGIASHAHTGVGTVSVRFGNTPVTE
jgi:hypothetical protein